VQDRLQGEGNFSYSRFDADPKLEQPSFDRAEFVGPAFFHRTVFCNGVSMEEVAFKEKAHFEGSTSDICVARARIVEMKIQQSLVEALQSKDHRIISINTDHDDHYNFNWNIRSEQSLKKAIAKMGSPYDAVISSIDGEHLETIADESLKISVEALIGIWRDGICSTMFSGDGSGRKVEASSFRGSQFCAGSSFSRVNLGRCLLQSVNVSNIDFNVVEWSRQPCGLVVRRLLQSWLRQNPGWILTDRAALWDELELDEDERKCRYPHELSNRRKELSELYRELRIAYDREGDTQTGRDFYFGEVEAERLSYGEIHRTIGLSNWYRWLSGYSKREGLALSWLLAFILVIFPVLFWGLVNEQERRHLQTPYFEAVSGNTVPNAQPVCRVANNSSLSDVASNNAALQDEPAKTKLEEEQREKYKALMAKASNAVSGNGSGLWTAVNASLEASTFLPSSGMDAKINAAEQMLDSIRCPADTVRQSSYTDAAKGLATLERDRRGLQALERLIVPAQLALFLLALRSKFQRTR